MSASTSSLRTAPASPTVLWLIGFFAFLNVYSMQSVLPLVMREFAASPVAAGATVGATVLAVALVSPFIGMLSDAFGRKRIICTALFALTVPTALIASANSLSFVVFCRFLQGLTIPGIVVVVMAYIGEEFRVDRVARMTAIYVGGTVMGGFCGRFITGHAGHLLGWRGAFLVLAGLNLIGGVFVWRRLPPSRNFVASRHLAQSLRTLAGHLHNRRLLAACAVGFCVLFSLVGAFTYINLMLAEPPFELTTAGLANIFSVYLVGVVVTPLAGTFIARCGFLRSLLGALMVAAIGLVLTLNVSLPVVIAGLALCSTGVFICQSATVGFIANNVSEGRSLASGIYNLCYYAGGSVGSLLAGLAFEHWGWGGSVVSIVMVQTLGALIAMIGWRQPNPVRQAELNPK